MKLILVFTAVTIISFYVTQSEAFWFSNLFSEDASQSNSSIKKKRQKGDEMMKSMIMKVKQAREDLEKLVNGGSDAAGTAPGEAAPAAPPPPMAPASPGAAPAAAAPAGVAAPAAAPGAVPAVTTAAPAAPAA